MRALNSKKKYTARTKQLTSRKKTRKHCSPKELVNNPTGMKTCYNNKSLNTLKTLWNKKNPDRMITYDKPEDIREALRLNMKKNCNNERCWLKHVYYDRITNDELNGSFTPLSPKTWINNPNEWLSSDDIINVMNQYETAYKCFKFIGPSPIDFYAKQQNGQCVWNDICNLNLKQMVSSGKKKLGFIFNTDPHYKGGSHWISLFVNLKKGNIFFFDSAGSKMPKEIDTLVKNIVKQGQEITPRITFAIDQNYPVEHQYGNTECGVYSIYFIVHMLEDKVTGNYLKTHILKDKYMQKFRKVYFTPYND